MAGELLRADESKRGTRAWKRGWFPYAEYQVVHQSSMESLAREGLVHRETLTFREVVAETGAIRAVNLRGRVECSDGVMITVNKWLDVALDDRNQLVVQGRWYQYHAWLRGRPRRDLLRYDNSHAAELHRHFYDDMGREVGIEPVALDTLPRLDLLIREAVALGTGASLDEIHEHPRP